MANDQINSTPLLNPEFIAEDTQQIEATGFKRYYEAAKRTGQAAIVLAEVLPANEAIRLGIYSAAVAATHAENPLVGAIALGGSTFAIEAGAGLASASLFDTPRSKKLFDAINEKGAKLKLPMDKKLSTPVKTWATFMGGTVVGMALEEREDPTRTVAQNRRYAITTSLWQAGILAGAGAAGNEAIQATLENPQQSAVVGLGVASVAAAGVTIKKIHTRIKNRHQPKHRGTK